MVCLHYRRYTSREILDDLRVGLKNEEEKMHTPTKTNAHIIDTHIIINDHPILVYMITSHVYAK